MDIELLTERIEREKRCISDLQSDIRYQNVEIKEKQDYIKKCEKKIEISNELISLFEEKISKIEKQA